MWISVNKRKIVGSAEVEGFRSLKFNLSLFATIVKADKCLTNMQANEILLLGRMKKYTDFELM